MGIARFDLVLARLHGHRQEMEHQLIFSLHQAIRPENVFNEHILRLSQISAVEPDFANGIQPFKHQLRNISLLFFIMEAARVECVIAFILLKKQHILVFVDFRDDAILFQRQCQFYRHLGFHPALTKRGNLRNRCWN